MAMNECVDAISQALGREPTENELENIARAVQARYRARIDDGMAPREAARAVGAEVSDAMAVQKARAEWNAHNNILKQADLHARDIQGNQALAEKGLLSPTSTTANRGSGISITGLRRVFLEQLTKPAIAELKKAGILKLFAGNDRQFGLNLARELWRRDDPARGPASGDTRAVTAAKVMGKMLDTQRAMLNKEGAFVGKVDGYMGRQWHDMWKIRADTFDNWRGEMLKRFDTEHDYEGMEQDQIDASLRAEYKSHVSGLYDGPSNYEGGTANVATRASQERTHTPRSADDWFLYNEKYGAGNVHDALWSQADRAARDTALMRTFGTNPEKGFNDWHDSNMRKAYARGDNTEGDDLKSNPNRGLFQEVSGLGRVPGNATLATIGANLRSFQQLLHLGSIMGSAIVHAPINALMLRHNGVPFLEGMANQMRSLLPPGKFRGEMAESLLAAHDGMMGHFVHQFWADDMLGKGTMSNTVDAFHKWVSLFGPFMDNQKAGAGLGLARSLGYHADTAFEELNPRMQTSLRRYGIEQPEWDQVRQFAKTADDGKQYVVPSEITDPGLRDKVQTYITDQIMEGANEPTPWARNVAALGSSPGTFGGELVRTLAQFKSFAITMVERQWGREVRRNGVDVPGVFLMASMLTAFGFIGNQLRGLVSNQRQTMPQDGEGWMKMIGSAAGNGGALGLLGDAFLRDSGRTGGDMFKGLIMGPGAAVPFDAASLLKNLYQGPQSETGRATRGTTALNDLHAIGNDVAPNIWMLRAAYSYLTPYMIANMIHPGAVQRHAQVMRKNNEAWILPPH